MTRRLPTISSCPASASAALACAPLRSGVLALTLCLNVTSPALAQDNETADSRHAFVDADLDQWKTRVLEGESKYRLAESDGIRAVEASTSGTASILYRRQKIDLGATPVIEWSWKVETLYQDIDQQSRQGDDFPARLYVVLSLGPLPWQTLAINYVWSTEVPEGSVWLNPFTDKAAMIAVRSGPDHLGEWVSERRNIVEDFRTAFGRDADRIDGYAIMIDGDNSGQSARSWFGRIAFKP